jgi:hypothetical protein
MSVASIFKTETSGGGSGGRIPRHLHVAGADDDAYHTSREHDDVVLAEMEQEFSEGRLLRNPRWLGLEAISGVRHSLLSRVAAENLLRREVDSIGIPDIDLPPAIA